MPTDPTTQAAQAHAGHGARTGAVRLGVVRYLNALPLIYGLEKLGAVEIVLDAPAGLPAALEAGEVDIALAPVVAAVRPATPLVFLPAGCIGSDGPTHTVRLFSKVPLGRVRRVAVDAESRTSVELLRVLWRRRYSVEVQTVAFDAAGVAETDADAVLLIGDKVVTAPPAERAFPFDLDLGAAWRDLTGLPFVYAGWVARAQLAGEPRLRRTVSILDRQRRRNAARLAEIASARGPAMGWPVGVARKYVSRTLVYDPCERARAGLARFFEELGAPAPAWL